MKTRNPYYDNLKFILMILVVLSHFGFEQKNEPSMHAILNVLAAFVVPVYAVISGFFSRKITAQRKEDVLTLLVPYLILEVIHLGFTKVTGMGKGDVHIEVPTYQNWYLLTLFFWRMMIPYFRYVKPLAGVLIALCIGFSVGFFGEFNDFLDLHRTLYFFPFFIVGYYTEDLLAVIEKYKSLKWLSAIYLIVFVVAISYFTISKTEIAEKLLYLFAPMFGYGKDLGNFILRLAAFGVTSVTVFAFLLVMTDKATFFTKFGANTFNVYVFHMFLVWPLIPLIQPYTPIFSEFLALVLSVMITFLLSSTKLAPVFKPIINPLSLFPSKGNKV